MKRQIIIFSLCFIIGIFTLSAQKCDTLKWQTIETYYAKAHGGTYYKLNDGTILNMDTLSTFYPAIKYINISNDTFYKNTDIEFCIVVGVHSNTGAIGFFMDTRTYFYPHDILPGDTVDIMIGLGVNLNNVVLAVEEKGLTIEDISYCQIVTSVLYTEKDGQYTDSVFYLGADTATFHVIKSPVSILESTQTEISVFPNPAQSHFTVTNTENANLTLYNVLGQKVKQVLGEGESTIIRTEGLPQGIYLLKVEKEGAVLTKKIQISN